MFYNEEELVIQILVKPKVGGSLLEIMVTYFEK